MLPGAQDYVIQLSLIGTHGRDKLLTALHCSISNLPIAIPIVAEVEEIGKPCSTVVDKLVLQLWQEHSINSVS